MDISKEYLYKLVTESARDPVFVKGLDSRYLYANQAYIDLIGKSSKGGIIGKTDHQLMSSSQAKVNIADDQNVFKTGKALTAVRKIVCKKGEELYFQVVKTPIKNDKGRVIGLIGIARDIAEYKRIEDALRESECFYRSLVENIKLGITVIDSNYKIIMTNSMQGKFFDKSVSEFIGKECFREFEKRDKVCAHCPGRIAMATGKPAEVETAGVQDSGKVFPVIVKAFPLFNAEGRTKGFIEVIEDMTEQKRITDVLRETEKTARALLDATTDSVLLVDKKGIILDLNESMAARLCKTRGQLIGKDAYEYLSRDIGRTRRKFMNRAINTGKPVRLEDQREDRWLDNVMYPILDANGKAERLAVFAHDITERVKIEKELQESAKMISLGRFIAGAAHEINNPLGVISANAQYIVKNFGKKKIKKITDNNFKEIIDCITLVNDQAQRCGKITSDLLQFARKYKLNKKLTGINECVKDAFAMLEHQPRSPKIKVVQNFDPKLPKIKVDAVKLELVFNNIILNAYQAMPRGGILSVSTGRKGGFVEIEFSDTGAGISQENLTRVFEPFFTTREAGKGTGLGLAISYIIVKNHGGDVKITSKPGRGTKVIVLLPASKK